MSEIKILLEMADELDELGKGTPEYAMPEVFGEAADVIRRCAVALEAPDWEYGWNTGSEVVRIGDREQIESWAAARGWKVGIGDWGSRIMRRRKAGEWEEVAS